MLLLVLAWFNCQRAGWASSLLATVSLLSFSKELGIISIYGIECVFLWA